MMRPEDIIENWNEAFPDCKLQEKDLAKPTETMVTNAFVAYLRAFNEKWEAPTAEHTDKDKRNFKINLVQRIDGILKISKDTYAFTYWDLKQPTRKKIAHTLNILHNYYCYWSMYKEEALGKCNQLLAEQLQLQQDIDRENNVNHKIEQLTMQRSELKKQLKIIKETLKKQQKKAAQLHESFSKLTIQKEELKTEHVKLQQQVVPDDEAQHLQTQLAEIEKKLLDTQNIEKILSSQLAEFSENIEKSTQCIKEIDELKQILPKNVQQFVIQRNTKQSLDTELESLKNEKAAILEKCQQYENEIKLLDVQHEKYIANYLQLKANKQHELRHEKQLLNREKERVEELHRKEHYLVGRLNEQAQIAAFIRNEMAVLMKRYICDDSQTDNNEQNAATECVEEEKSSGSDKENQQHNC